MTSPVPLLGDVIYVPDADVVHQTYIRGGRATVSEVTYENGRAWVCVAEIPGDRCAWDFIGPMQDDLRAWYGDTPAGKYVMRPEDARDAEPGATAGRGPGSGS